MVGGWWPVESTVAAGHGFQHSAACQLPNCPYLPTFQLIMGFAVAATGWVAEPTFNCMAAAWLTILCATKHTVRVIFDYSLIL